MNDSLNLIYIILSKFFNFMFGSYLFDGVSLGMVLLVSGLFVVMLNYIIAIPKMKVSDHRTTLVESDSFNVGNTKYSYYKRSKVGK